jgi:small conductance mechanosensitive channel
MVTGDTVNTIVALLGQWALKIIGALLIWFIGRWLIGLAVRSIRRTMERRKLDPTLLSYLSTIISVSLHVLLVLGILGYFGVQTATFAALIASLGVAIGLAWSGLLANFAAGVFMLVLRPFKVGDAVAAGGVTGTVKEIGLVVTTITTGDNIETYVGNNKIFSDNIQNFSVNSYRRVDCMAQLNSEVDPQAAMALLKERLSQIPNVRTDPAPDVEILEWTLAGPVLAVRPYCHNNHYWQVYFDTNRLISSTFGEAGFPAPAQHYVLQGNGKALVQ